MSLYCAKERPNQPHKRYCSAVCLYLLSPWHGLALGPAFFYPQPTSLNAAMMPADTQPISPPLTVEIWSDVLCPFCYIGKRQFEAALAQYAGRDKVKVTWRSFQLDPDLPTDPSKTLIQSLSERKGWSEAHARQATDYVTEMAREVGLLYRLDRCVVANSFDAHRLIQLGQAYGKASAANERLFAAYFTEGRNIADPAVLLDIGITAGLEPKRVQQMLASSAYADAVREDIALAHRFGVKGVPFFLFNRRQAVSGAQGTAVFVRLLLQAAEQQNAQH